MNPAIARLHAGHVHSSSATFTCRSPFDSRMKLITSRQVSMSTSFVELIRRPHFLTSSSSSTGSFTVAAPGTSSLYIAMSFAPPLPSCPNTDALSTLKSSTMHVPLSSAAASCMAASSRLPLAEPAASNALVALCISSAHTCAAAFRLALFVTARLIASLSCILFSRQKPLPSHRTLIAPDHRFTMSVSLFHLATRHRASSLTRSALASASASPLSSPSPAAAPRGCCCLPAFGVRSTSSPRSQVLTFSSAHFVQASWKSLSSASHVRSLGHASPSLHIRPPISSYTSCAVARYSFSASCAFSSSRSSLPAGEPTGRCSLSLSPSIALM